MWKILVLVMLCGCGVHFEPTRPATITAKPGAFDQAIGALVAAGESIDTKDEAAGTIVTKWVDLEQMGSDFQTRLVLTATGGKLIIASQCQRRMKDAVMSKSWDSCGERQPGTQQAKIDRIAAALR